MKRVLLLGDSIRIGYQPLVCEGFQGRAEVVAPEENGRFAKHTLWGINLWMRDLGKPDIVHWNNGLWDLHHEPPMVEALTSLDEYIMTMKRILNELQRTRAHIIFATTTPILPDGTRKSNAEIDLYNTAVVQVLRENGIEINDLNHLVKQDLDSYISDDKVHLTERGNRVCAEQVIAKIIPYL